MFDVVSLSLRYQSGDWEGVIEKTNHRVAEVEPLGLHSQSGDWERVITDFYNQFSNFKPVILDKSESWETKVKS